MDRLQVLSEETSGSITIKSYDLNHYRTQLTEQQQEQIWTQLTNITLEHCLPFQQGVLMEYLEVADTFEAAFRGPILLAFKITGNDNLVDPDEPEETLSTFVCPYGTRIFGEPARRARAALGMALAAKPGSVLPQVPKEVEAHIASFLTDVKKPTVQEQLKVLKGQSRVNRKTRRSKGKRGNPKRQKLRNLTSRRR